MAAGLSFDRTITRLWAARRGAGGSAVSVFGVRVAAAGFAFLAQVLMARLMGGVEYGLFAGIWVWVALLGHAATLGFSQGACRFLPADQVIGRWEHVRGFLRGGALVTALVASGVAALGFGALRLLGAVPPNAYGTALLVAACVIPLFALQDYLEGVARSQNWAVLAIAPPYLLRQALLVLAMAAAVLGGFPADAATALSATLIAVAVALVVQGVWLLVRLRDRVPAGVPRYRWRHWLDACLPIAIGDLATAAFCFVDVLVLGFLVSPEAVGVYFAATRIQQFVTFVHYASTAATAQRFSAAKARGDAATLSSLVREQARWTSFATAIVAMGVLASAPLLLGFFGSGFGSSVPILAVLVLGSAITSLFGPGEDVLVMLGGERLCAAITAGALVLAALLILALVPWLGLIGAAVAMCIASALRALAMALGARRLHGLSTPVFPLQRAAAGS